MITRNEIKFIRSLQLKKNRKETGRFLVEGEKNVLELLRSDIITEWILATPEFLSNHHWIKNIPNVRIIETTSEDLSKTGTLESNEAALAVVKIPAPGAMSDLKDNLILLFDNLRDPGNLGTILRIADWYGIHSVILSNDSVDVYNPKVIQSSMGSFLRVHVLYSGLPDAIEYYKRPVIGTFMEGQSVYEFNFPTKALLLFGNESQGINNAYYPYLNFRICIPKVGKAESLNVAISSAILLDNYNRGQS